MTSRDPGYVLISPPKVSHQSPRPTNEESEHKDCKDGVRVLHRASMIDEPHRRASCGKAYQKQDRQENPERSTFEFFAHGRVGNENSSRGEFISAQLNLS